MSHMDRIRTGGPDGYTTIGIRTKDVDLHKRFMHVSIDEGLSMANLLSMLLDLYDERRRRVLAAQKHPGHLPDVAASR